MGKKPIAGNLVNRARSTDATVKPYDRCQTPAYALQPLLAHIPIDWRVWEPAMGEGNLVRAFEKAGYNVAGSDIAMGADFLAGASLIVPSHCIVTNPPFTRKFGFLAECYRRRQPFALLCRVDTIGAAKAQCLFEKYGIHIGLLDKRVDFKMPNAGYDGAGAHFPVAWFTWGLVDTEPLMYWHIDKTGERDV